MAQLNSVLGETEEVYEQENGSLQKTSVSYKCLYDNLK